MCLKMVDGKRRCKPKGIGYKAMVTKESGFMSVYGHSEPTKIYMIGQSYVTPNTLRKNDSETGKYVPHFHMFVDLNDVAKWADVHAGGRYQIVKVAYSRPIVTGTDHNDSKVIVAREIKLIEVM